MSIGSRLPAPCNLWAWYGLGLGFASLPIIDESDWKILVIILQKGQTCQWSILSQENDR